MPTLTRTALVAASGAALVATVAACGSSGDATPVVAVPSLDKGVSTSVTLDGNFAQSLTSLKVTPSAYGTASLSTEGVASFPITGGHVTVYKKGAVTPYVQGEIDHNGSGLTLSAGGKKVTLENFVINPGNNSNLTGTVLLNGTQAAPAGTKLFDLDGTTLKTPTISDGVAKLTGTRVYLSSTAAKLLDSTFGTTALTGHTLVGVATILAHA